MIQVSRVNLFIFALIAFISVGGGFQTAAHAAVPLAHISVTATVPNIDGEFDVTVSISTISGNPGVSGFVIWLNFDKTVIEPLSISQGAIVSPEFGIQSNLLEPGVDKSKLDAVSAVWVNKGGNIHDIAKDGKLFTVRFKTKPAVLYTTNIDIDAVKSEVSYRSVNANHTFEGAFLQFFSIDIISDNINKNGVIDLDIWNGTASPKNVTVVVAVYDKRNVLRSIVYDKNRQLKAGSNKIGYSNITAGETLKITLWDAAMCPLIIPVTK